MDSKQDAECVFAQRSLCLERACSHEVVIAREGEEHFLDMQLDQLR